MPNKILIPQELTRYAPLFKPERVELYASSVTSAPESVVFLTYEQALNFLSGELQVEAALIVIDYPDRQLASMEDRARICRFNGLPNPSDKTTSMEVECKSASLEMLRDAALVPDTIVPVPDQAGLVSARAIIMIMAEAARLAASGVATEGDIDTAMRLGTGYPMGPFAWRAVWGEKRVRGIAAGLLAEDPTRYAAVCVLLGQDD